MNDRLNIALLSIHSCPYAVLGSKDTGGMNVYIRELSRELIYRGHRVDIYTASHKCGHCSLMQPGVDLKIIHLENSICPESPLYDVKQQTNILADEINNLYHPGSYKYDLIHSHYWQSGIVGNLLQKTWNVPHITMFHTLSAVKKLLNAENTDPLFRAELEKEVMENADRVIASTPREKYYMQKLYRATPEKISIIPCGINLELFKTADQLSCRKSIGLNNEDKIAIFVGRLEPLKGIDNLLKSISIIKDISPLKLLILGGDENNREYRAMLEKSAADLGISDRVSFIGSVLQKELPVYYSAADMTVVPSYYESFGLVTLESLACGTPVLTNSVGISGEVIKHSSAGAIMQSNSPQDIAESILNYIDNKFSARNAEFARKAVEKYNWSFISDLIINEYDHVIKSRNLCGSIV